jgi:hypothetical protein
MFSSFITGIVQVLEPMLTKVVLTINEQSPLCDDPDRFELRCLLANTLFECRLHVCKCCAECDDVERCVLIYKHLCCYSLNYDDPCCLVLSSPPQIRPLPT